MPILRSTRMWMLVGFLNLIEAARKQGLKRVVFSSTGGAIYGEQDEFPCTEDHAKRSAR